MITIDQLLESVDLDFEPRFVTKRKNGEITIFAYKPELKIEFDRWVQTEWGSKSFGPIKLAEFDGKDWTECIYEVPRKVDPIKWIGKLCVFGKGAPDEKYGILEAYDPDPEYPFFIKGYEDWYTNCEPVHPDDDVIYKGE